MTDGTREAEPTMDDGERLELLANALKTMLGAFDTPVARRRMNDHWSSEARAYARECYERATGRTLNPEA